jgi:hypothetical protein
MKINSTNPLFRYLFLAFGIASLHPTFGQALTNEKETLQILGHYSHIFSNGAPPKTNNYSFIAFTASNGWKISITNANQPKEWGIMRYDGTNIYMIGTDLLNAYTIYGYVYPGQFYVPEAADDSVKPFFPWMVFYLTPQMIRDFERKGIIDMPTPWGRRYSLLDYGYKWKTHYSDDGKVIQRIDIVRDSTLDLKTEEDELRRASINYPFEYSSREHRLQALHVRKNVPDGFVRATYECEAVCQTNSTLIPSAAKFAEYWPNFNEPQGPSRLVFEMALQVDEIKLLQNADISEIISPAKMSVSDYRYQTTTSRTKFNFATYTLNAGDSFPSGNDSVLLAQAKDWIKHGSAYDSLQSKRGKILVGMLTVTFVTTGLLVFWLIRNNKQTKGHKNET